MKNKVSFLLLGLLASSTTLLAQQSDVTTQAENEGKTKIDYGRGIAYDLKESTTATAVATEEQLSHRSSINPSNLLYGLIPGLQVLQKAGFTAVPSFFVLLQYRISLVSISTTRSHSFRLLSISTISSL